MLSDKKFSIEMSNHEALVLFEVLSSFFDEGKAIRPITGEWFRNSDGIAAELVLNSIHCSLEEFLVEPSSDQYDKCMSESYSAVIDGFFGEEE